MKRLSALVVLFCVLSGVAFAHPDGAPWGAADPSAGQNCASCHFDGEAVQDSQSISIFYTETQINPGEAIDLYLQFRNPTNKKAGFQIIATAGAFTSVYEDIETNGEQVRSNAPRDNSSWPELLGIDAFTNVVMWRLQWTPPATPVGEVFFLISVNESDDDASPFGDQIHFKKIGVVVSGDFRLLPALR